MKPTPHELRALARRDRTLGTAMRGLPPFPAFPTSRTTPWRSLARAIVFQQLHGAAASAIHARVCTLGGSKDFPAPAVLVELDDVRLRACGLSRGKIAALRDLASRSIDGRLPLTRLSRFADERVIELVSEVHGLGRWSAQMFLMFHLGRLDVLPSGDLGVREGLRIVDGLTERPSVAEVEARGACWSPLSSVAAWYLWRIVERERERAKSLGAPASKPPGTRASRARSRPSDPR